MTKYFKNRFGGSINLVDKTHPKPQRRPEKAKNQLDVCLDKEKIMKSNQAKPRNPRRIPARPGGSSHIRIIAFITNYAWWRESSSTSS